MAEQPEDSCFLGMLGNQDALSDYYPALNTYNIGATYPFGGALNSGYYQSSYKLSTITWEKATTWVLVLISVS